MDKIKRVLVLSLFGVAFAFVEAVVVFYLRQVLGFGSNLFSPQGYSILLNLGFISFLSRDTNIIPNLYIARVEFFREAATILMLLSLSYLAGQNFRQRLATFLITFALWDLFYYLFLKVLIGWPKSIFDLDVFFLIPVAWVGPVITPVVISTLLLVLGVVLFLRRSS